MTSTNKRDGGEVDYDELPETHSPGQIAEMLRESDAAYERIKARAERLAGALREVDEYLADREDVIDGDYGRPEPNDEMLLRQVVRAALNLEPRND